MEIKETLTNDFKSEEDVEFVLDEGPSCFTVMFIEGVTATSAKPTIESVLSTHDLSPNEDIFVASHLDSVKRDTPELDESRYAVYLEVNQA
jgi:hypothetical protein